VILTPHGAGNTADNSENMVEIIMNNITMMEAGNMPEARYVVNAQYLQ
jgi:phosphoglycerate dehydrogenase-like enzyme